MSRASGSVSDTWLCAALLQASGEVALVAFVARCRRAAILSCSSVAEGRGWHGGFRLVLRLQTR